MLLSIKRKRWIAALSSLPSLLYLLYFAWAEVLPSLPGPQSLQFWLSGGHEATWVDGLCAAVLVLASVLFLYLSARAYRKRQGPLDQPPE